MRISSLRINTDTGFHRYVDGLLCTTPVPGASWSDDRATIRFPKRKATGYDIEVGYWPSDGILWLATDRGYHDHVHPDDDAALAECLDRTFGLVRDMLSSSMRILETCNGGVARKWELQVNWNGHWVTESSTGLVLWNYFGRRTRREYSNDTLPPRLPHGAWPVHRGDRQPRR